MRGSATCSSPVWFVAAPSFSFFLRLLASQTPAAGTSPSQEASTSQQGMFGHVGRHFYFLLSHKGQGGSAAVAPGG